MKNEITRDEICEIYIGLLKSPQAKLNNNRRIRIIKILHKISDYKENCKQALQIIKKLLICFNKYHKARKYFEGTSDVKPERVQFYSGYMITMVIL